MLHEKAWRLVQAGALRRNVSVLRPRLDAGGARIVGFDTEYTSARSSLLSFQLWGKRGGAFCRPPLSLERLVKIAGPLSPGVGTLFLVTYFSLAELQFLPVFRDGVKFFVGSRGSLDVSFRVGEQDVEVFDLARFYDGRSLAEAAKAHGLAKLEWDRTRVSRASLRSARFRAYALKDAELCFQLASELRSEYLESGVDMLRARTPASVSASIFRRLIPDPFDAPHPRARYLALLATWGGRTEVYRRGRVGEVTEVDITSAYPNAALSFAALPDGDDWEELGPRIGTWKGVLGGFARVLFDYPASENYPALPVVAEGFQLYPRSGCAFVTVEEVLYAKARGAKLKILEAWGFRRGRTDFQRYLARLIDARATAEGAKRVALKLSANSIIGKLAQAVEDYSLDDVKKAADSIGVTMADIVALPESERVELGVKPKVSLGSCFLPEWNGLVTGRVRVRLAKLMRSLGEPVYSATDAVWIRGAIEAPPGTSVKCRGRATVARTRLASIWRRPVPHVVHHSFFSRTAAADLLRRFDGSEDLEVSYQIRRPVKALESLRLGLPLGKWIRQTRLGDTAWDGKRKLLADGSTEPWENVSEFLAAREPEA